MTQAGPADCVPADVEDEEEVTEDAAGGASDPPAAATQERGAADDVAADIDVTANCAASFDGGSDHLTAVRYWDIIMKKYKVSQTLDEELARLNAAKEPAVAETLREKV